MLNPPKSLIVKLLMLVALMASTMVLSLPSVTAQAGTYCGDLCVTTDEGHPGCLIGEGSPTRACRLQTTRCSMVACPSDPGGGPSPILE